ncbi:MAG: hypothetical protein MRY81_03490 [Donghicola eburneus]|nr:hypothetical protein [Donghicola eburneus]MCI5038726.1 hypothetical protein [Donghicola eburneus]
MSIHTDFERVNSFLINLELLNGEGRTDAYFNECIETGGTYTDPAYATGATHLFEIDLHDIHATGSSHEEVQRNWSKLARQLGPDIEDDGFITVHPALPQPIEAVQQ